MIIKNFDKLANTELRKDALMIVEAGFEAIQTRDVIEKSIFLKEEVLKIKDQEFDLEKFSSILLFGIGKGSFEAVGALEELLGQRVSKGIVIDVQGGQLKRVKSVIGTHPIPSQKNVDATKEILNLLKPADEKRLILFVIAGGGSALLTAPFKISVEKKGQILDELMKANADITELNIVRKHLSEVKGGRFAKLAFPSRVVSLIFSDVPGNDLPTIASGPTVLDSTTSDQAEQILRKRGVWEKLNLDGLEFSETPKEEKYFSQVTNILLQDPSSAVVAMEKKALELGWKTRVLGIGLKGEAVEFGASLLSQARPGEALLASGETTVNVVGDGVGGRNQHLVLGNLRKVRPDQVIIAAASDGHDHSESAGAIGDGTSLERAKEKGLNLDEFLSRADSFEFFQSLGDSIQTGLLESNVADFFLVLKK